MLIDITATFPHKKAFVNSIEVQIKSVSAFLEAEYLTNGEIRYTDKIEITSRRGNVYNIYELTFIV